MRPRIVVLDYGSGNVRSAVRALAHVGADTQLSADPRDVAGCDGLVVPGVGNFHACMEGLTAINAPALIDRRLAGGRPVLGICVGMQVMFEGSDEPAVRTHDGLGEWPGRVVRLDAPVIPHTGWSSVVAPEDTTLFAGVGTERFYFVHSYAVRQWERRDPAPSPPAEPAKITTADHFGSFVAAVENGPLCATQFHPEKSGEPGLQLLENWLSMV